MEPFIADLINNSKVPKFIRYIIVTMICAFIIFIGIAIGLKSEMLIGKIFGILLSIIFVVIAIYFYMKIYKSEN